MCVCGVCGGGEGRMAVVSGWLVPLENSTSSFSFLRRAESSAGRSTWRLWEKSSDAAKRYPERRRTSSCNAAHFSSLIELCRRRSRGDGGGALKLFLGAFLFFPSCLPFLMVTACLLASAAFNFLILFALVADGNWFLAVRRYPECLIGMIWCQAEVKAMRAACS